MSTPLTKVECPLQVVGVGVKASDDVFGCKPGQCYMAMENRLLPMQHVPALHVVDGSKGKQGRYSLAEAPPERGCSQRRTALETRTPDYLSRLTPTVFTSTKDTHKKLDA